MTKILIVYDSRTGNTEKMALAVAEGVKKVKDAKAVVKAVDKAKLGDLTKADAIILGSPTYYGNMSGKMKSFIDKTYAVHGKLMGKVGGAFTSSGDTACGAETTLLSMLKAMLIHGMVVQGRYENKHYGPTAVESPNTKEIESCEELGERVARLAVALRK
ncbi:MAG: NAD(P)H-dependent oxidoreductase [Candidatus Thermoplasmatota archaeon]|nr:NAD(P)H-dependent oxidoreductase [Candidatus Thermoplasmatota archaeon]